MQTLISWKGTNFTLNTQILDQIGEWKLQTVEKIM
jgi:hypothetical protein